MKKQFIILSTMFIFLISFNTVYAKQVKIEGTVKGLMCVLAGDICPVGEESLVTAIERTYVLLTDDGQWYLVPTFTTDQVSPYLNKRVRIEGDLVFNGKGINAITAEVYENGKWETQFSQQTVIEKKRNRALAQSAKAVLTRLH